MDDQRINKNLALPVTVDILLPHRLPMCLVDRLVEFDDNSGVVEACIGPDSLLVDKDGTLDRVVLIELIAQSYAAVKGYSDLLGGKEIKKGFLVAAKQIELNGRAAPGDLLRIRVSTTGVVGDFNIADGVITKDDMVLASGNITVWIS
jgi:3-hydroxyacyl-[acyl-carrier-protein] dehydratase